MTGDEERAVSSEDRVIIKWTARAHGAECKWVCEVSVIVRIGVEPVLEERTVVGRDGID